MKLKLHYIAIILLASISTAAYAVDDVKTVKSKLNEATVFFQGAELTHSASAALVKGENELKVEGLSPNIDMNSVKIKASNGVIISSFEFSEDYLSTSKVDNPLARRLQDSIDLYTKRLEQINTEIKINTELGKLLQKGTDKNVSGSEKGLGIDELVKTMEYYKSKSAELETVQSANNKKKKDYEAHINRLKNQLRLESTKNSKMSGVLRLELTSPLAVTCNFTISYYTTAASWNPYYDVNIESTDKPIKIVSKAKVRQTTSIDWQKVKLTLSTATPSNGKVAPLFKTWFLEPIRVQPRPLAETRAMQNSFSYANDRELQLDEVVVVGYGTQKKSALTGAVSGIQPVSPLYIVDGVAVDKGYYDSMDKNMVKDVSVLKDAAATSIYGSQASSGAIVITTKSMDDFITQAENELNMTFNIDIPYNVPGNGKEQSIVLQMKETPANYKYYCAPKLDKETYLLAEIAEWEKLNLLSGMANVTYDGNYIGESYIDARSTQDKLTLTLGSDKRVSVKREKMKDFSSTKFLGNDVKQVFTYKMTVKNNQNKPIKMVLKDQYPISTQKNIEVELLTKETTTPTVNKEDLGVLTWEEELNAGETKTYQVSYSVKYPKGSNLNL